LLVALCCGEGGESANAGMLKLPGVFKNINLKQTSDAGGGERNIPKSRCSQGWRLCRESLTSRKNTEEGGEILTKNPSPGSEGLWRGRPPINKSICAGLGSRIGLRKKREKLEDWEGKNHWGAKNLGMSNRNALAFQKNGIRV